MTCCRSFCERNSLTVLWRKRPSGARIGKATTRQDVLMSIAAVFEHERHQAAQVGIGGSIDDLARRPP